MNEGVRIWGSRGVTLDGAAAKQKTYKLTGWPSTCRGYTYFGVANEMVVG
jgi:hypothetical protein